MANFAQEKIMCQRIISDYENKWGDIDTGVTEAQYNFAKAKLEEIAKREQREAEISGNGDVEPDTVTEHHFDLKPVAWNEFRKWSKEQCEYYLKSLYKEFGVPSCIISTQMFGMQGKSLSAWSSKKGLGSIFKKERGITETYNKKGFEEWLRSGNLDTSRPKNRVKYVKYNEAIETVGKAKQKALKQDEKKYDELNKSYCNLAEDRNLLAEELDVITKERDELLAKCFDQQDEINALKFKVNALTEALKCVINGF